MNGYSVGSKLPAATACLIPLISNPSPRENLFGSSSSCPVPNNNGREDSAAILAKGFWPIKPPLRLNSPPNPNKPEKALLPVSRLVGAPNNPFLIKLLRPPPPPPPDPVNNCGPNLNKAAEIASKAAASYRPVGK